MCESVSEILKERMMFINLMLSHVFTLQTYENKKVLTKNSYEPLDTVALFDLI